MQEHKGESQYRQDVGDAADPVAPAGEQYIASIAEHGKGKEDRSYTVGAKRKDHNARCRVTASIEHATCRADVSTSSWAQIGLLLFLCGERSFGGCRLGGGGLAVGNFSGSPLTGIGIKLWLATLPVSDPGGSVGHGQPLVPAGGLTPGMPQWAAR